MTPEPRTHHLGAARRRAIALVLAVAVGAAAAATARPNTSLGRVFYLDLLAGQCAEGKVSATIKTLLVVPCSNGGHNLEVYARVRGGWPGAQIPPHNGAYVIAQRLCNSTFVRRYGRPIIRGYGWQAFWPDAGKEAAKYHDRIVCSLIRWPGAPPMGPGTHFRRAAGG